MRTFTLDLRDATRIERIDGVTSFVGEDRSGSFGICAGHERMMTCLTFGLARFRVEERDWQYLALPGALLRFDADVLVLSTRHYLVDDDYRRISVALREKLMAEEMELRELRDSLHRMDEEALKRMWRLGQVSS